MPNYRTAEYHVRADALGRCIEAIQEFVAYVRENEPGTLYYAAVQSQDDPTHFLHFMGFEDDAAEKTHRSSEGVARFTDVLYPRTVEGVVFSTYELIGTT